MRLPLGKPVFTGEEEKSVPEVQQIVALAERARARGEQVCLATVVHVEGSAYRKPGARMLLTSGGERAGAISGGCLEAEVSRKAWWLTAHGPRVERYSSFADEDGGLPYGLGCGGTISLLLEQGEAALATLDSLERALRLRSPAVVVMAIAASPAPGTLAVLELRSSSECGPVQLHPLPGVGSIEVVYPRRGESARRNGSLGHPRAAEMDANKGSLLRAAEAVFEQRQSCLLTGDFEPWEGGERESGEMPAYFIEYLAPPPALTIFGAGDDAQPIAELAHALGWRVTVADGRSHLARRERFLLADEVLVLDYADPSLRTACNLAHLPAQPSAPAPSSPVYRFLPAYPLPDDEIAVILTHSYEQDRALLAALLPRDLRYLGILGPRHRTARLLDEVTPLVGLSVAEAFERLHSPIGLDLGAGDPSSVALSIVAEIQAVLHERRVQVMRLKPVSGARPTQDSPFKEPINPKPSHDEFPLESAALPEDQRA